MPGKKPGSTEGERHTHTHRHSRAASTAQAELPPAELGTLGKYTKICLIVLFAFQQRKKRIRSRDGGNKGIKAKGWIAEVGVGHRWREETGWAVNIVGGVVMISSVCITASVSHTLVFFCPLPFVILSLLVSLPVPPSSL